MNERHSLHYFTSCPILHVCRLYAWYGDELIANRPSRYTPEEQLQILDSHPFFTGVCPDCGYKFDKNNPPKVHWDCPACDWVDEEV